MPPTVVARCSRAHLFRQHTRACQKVSQLQTHDFNLITPISLRQFSSASSSSSSPSDETDVSTVLSTPTWSIKSLLRDLTDIPDTPVSRTQLHHLLRLSALPPPSSPSEEASMLKTLSCQIHFVKQVQQIDTTGVTPLRSIRDETDEAHKENTINIERLRDSLEREEFVGRNRRIRRRRPDKMEHPDEGSWEEKDALLKSASKMMGKFFVVQSSEAKAE
ncbi:hypothetical protein CIHG_10299 [Coccidioides immitis H538.4]|uniref:Glutamyl-tRNA amidotransferase complex subunit Gta3 domain-containing protein n=2 Tax=Coccidioides immitis TaxID=5501 RepID=A0A0J8S7T9_COCIT|nr:hypothetical protein CIRG_05033 [Coccidioides immitis RMSCC 2394]KMU92449.1 hypothetical protein CIHG_10299 [Coccidioides immitis H538.4]